MTPPTLLPVHEQQRADAEMGAAWRRAEAALPPGWMLELVRWGAVWPEPNPHTGHPVQYRWRYQATAQETFYPVDRRTDPPSNAANADTPADALNALSAALERRREAGE